MNMIGGEIQPLADVEAMVKRKELPTAKELEKLFKDIQVIHKMITNGDSKAGEWERYLISVSSLLYRAYPKQVLDIVSNSSSSTDLLEWANDAMTVIAALYPYRDESTKIVFGGTLVRLRRVVNERLSKFRDTGNLEATGYLASISTLADAIYI